MTEDMTFAGFLHQVSPTYRWDYPYLRYIQRALQLMTDGVTEKLMILSPPRHIKTAMTTVRYAAYRRARQPFLRVLLSGPSQQLANNYSRRAALVAGGAFRAAGVGQALAGYGADLIIIDDPIRLFDQASAVELERMYEWYTTSVATRLLQGGQIMLNQSRVHQDDLAGRILKSPDGPHWTVVQLPAEAEEDDPLGRALGAALIPERYGRRALASIRAAIGADEYAALYQQRPRDR